MTRYQKEFKIIGLMSHEGMVAMKKVNSLLFKEMIDEKFVSGHGNMKKRKQSDKPIGVMGYLIPMPKKDEENPIVIPEFLRRDKNE